MANRAASNTGENVVAANSNAASTHSGKCGATMTATSAAPKTRSQATITERHDGRRAR